jgi:molecular chaperone DnaK
MGIAVGIDLGTTNSCIAVVADNRATVIGDLAGRRIQPSVVSFLAAEQVIAGHEAKERLIVDSHNTIYSFKRLLGRDFSRPEMRSLLSELPYKVNVGPDNIPSVAVQGREISLPEISALMLRHLKEIAQKSTGASIKEAIITVPANFNDLQRSSTKVAGRIAGFNVLRILNEPTAAALAYGFGASAAERIAVYDFGGGTFDITIVELSGDIYEVLSTAGDTFLGGDDFDKCVLDDMLDAFRREHKKDLRGDHLSLQRMRSVAEKVKCQLSVLDEVQATLRELGDPRSAVDFNYKLTRGKLESIVSPLIERSIQVCEEALRIAGIAPTSLDNVVLVGGTTRIPLVRSRVAQYFGMAPRTEINPDEVVAIGAAIQAFSLTGEQLPPRSSRPTPPAPPPSAPPPRREEHNPATWNSIPPVLEAFSDANDMLPTVSHSSKARGDATLAMGMRKESRHLPKTPAQGEAGILDLTNDALEDEQDLPEIAGVDLPAVSRRYSAPPHPPAPPIWDLPAPVRDRAELPAPVLPNLPARAHEPPPPDARKPKSMDFGSSRTEPQASFGEIDLLPEARPISSVPPVLAFSLPRSRDEIHGAAPVPAQEQGFSVPMTARAPSALLLDVTPRAIGVATAGGFCDICIERNAAIPVEQSRLFTTSTDLQTEVSIAVYQGESRRVEENTKLGEVQLSGIRPAPRGTIKIRVTFEINTDGILGVSARNEETGQAQGTRIVLSGGIDEDQVERLVRKYADKK